MELLVLVLVAATANWQAVETWHHGSIFTSFRAWLQAREGFMSDLLLCPFCLSHWTGLAAVCFLYHWREVGFPPVLTWLAVVRLSNLMNDAVSSFSKTPNRNSVALDKAFKQMEEMEKNGNNGS